MEFYIRKGANLPYLQLEVIQDGKLDYKNFMESLELSTFDITFINVVTGEKIIICDNNIILLKKDTNNCGDDQLVLRYSVPTFLAKGRYEAIVRINSPEGILTVPVREKLFINVI